ncbi:MAG TPA: PilN domain-containing protein [Beijerinckiaceae bacterium]|jgi:general secretion pathway protein L
MPVRAVLIGWLDALAALWVGWREQWRARRVLVVAHGKEGFTVRRETAGESAVLASVEAGAKVPDAVREEGRNGLVVLELAPDKVLQERLSVPRQAREFLPGIVRNQIERLSPWKADQAVYGFEVAESREDGAALDVTLLMTSRAIVDAARDEVAAAGLEVGRIVARREDGEAGRSVALWSAVLNAPGEGQSRARRAIAAGTAAFVGLSVALSAWAFTSGATIGSESEELASRIKALQRQVQGARAAASKAAPNPLEQAWAAKEAAPSAVITIEALSRVLPETAYLTELDVQGSTLRMIGLSTDAPSVIAPLEASGHLADVHFFAPTTRTADGTLFRFHVEARIQPRLEVTVR